MAIKELCCAGRFFLFDPENTETIIRSRGKFSSIYKGIDAGSGNAVVVKKFNPLQKFPQQAIQQFKKEAHIQINHPNIAQTIGYIFQDSEHFIIREYIDGCNSFEFLQKAKLKGRERLQFVIKAGIQILEALDALHNNQIIHCDIRPQNILITNKQSDINSFSIKLIDMGLAQRMTDSAPKRLSFALIYSSPEQLLNIQEIIHFSSDLYSLAVSIYELIVDRKAFYHDNPELLMHLQLTQGLKPSKEIPDSLFKILEKAMSKPVFKLPPNKYKKKELISLFKVAQSKRYANAIEFKNALQSLLIN